MDKVFLCLVEWLPIRQGQDLREQRASYTHRWWIQLDPAEDSEVKANISAKCKIALPRIMTVSFKMLKKHLFKKRKNHCSAGDIAQQLSTFLASTRS